MKIPSQAELEVLRKGKRKRKVPKIFDGMWASEPGVGGVKFTLNDLDYLVEWVTSDNGIISPQKTASWKSLCQDPDHEMYRLEIGLTLSELFGINARRIMDSIGHPMTAIYEAKPYLAEAENWKHWAIVKSGHMLGL